MRPVKGLNKDADERSQPEGTYTEALNASLDEELGVLRREKGLELVFQFSDETIQGHIILDSSTQSESRTGNLILFLYNSDTGESRIVEWDVANQTAYTYLTDGGSVSGGDIEGLLQFDEPIQAIYRKIETGDVVVYWTDGVRAPRFFNIDKGSPNNVNDLDIFGKIESGIDLKSTTVREFGGNLKGGAYQFAFAYVDQDGSTTNYFYVSNPVSITSRNGFGVDSETNTSKAIEFELDQLDTDYPFLRVAVIKGTQVETLPDIPLNESSLTYTFTGNENSTIGSLDDIIINTASYKSAGVIQDHEGALYMADLKKEERVDLQKHANDITLDVITKPVTDIIDTNQPLEAFTDPDFASIGTYKRGEVYAFYISYLLRDGSETSAFHIPGRAPNPDYANKFTEAKLQIDSIPRPEESFAQGAETNISSVPSQGEAASGVPISINSGTSKDDSFIVAFYTDTDARSATASVSVSSGDSPNQIAQKIADALNANSTFTAQFSASMLEGGTGYANVKMTATDTGSEYNGHYLKIEGDAGHFDYGDQFTTSGGKDDTSSAPNRTITFSFDNSSQNIAVNVTNLNGLDSAVTVAQKYSNAIDGASNLPYHAIYDSNESQDFLSIISDNIGRKYNGSFAINDIDANDFGGGFISAGWDPNNDTIEFDIKWHSSLSALTITGIKSTDNLSTVADKIANQSGNALGSLDFDTNSNIVVATASDNSFDGNAIASVGKPDSLAWQPSAWGFTETAWTEKQEGGNPLDRIASDHPLKSYESDFGNLYNYQVDNATVSPINKGYWENKSESYSNDSRWTIVDKNGNVKGDLREENIRHHKFPGIKQKPHIDENPDSGDANMYIFGIKPKDVHVPSEIEDDVVGYKLYYAKKNPKDRVVLDQSLGLYGWLDESDRKRKAQQRNEVFTNDVWSPHGFGTYTDFDGVDDVGWDTDSSLVQFHPFESMRKGLGIQGVTHIRINGAAGNQSGTLSSPEDKWESFSPDNLIRKVDAISYIEQNARDVSLSKFGFSKNYDNLLGESKIIAELANDLSAYPQVPLCDLCQLKNNVHRPYDNQELVFTGFIGDIDTTNANAPVIYGGDINIEPWFFKAHTLLALAEKDAWSGDSDDNDWWGRNDGRTTLKDSILSEANNTIFGQNINKDERDGLVQAMQDIIGNTSGIENLPIAWGTLWVELAETRDHPWFRTEGDTNIESFYPASKEYIASPDIEDVPQDISGNDTQKAYEKSKWIFTFFKKSDNWYGYNDEYSKENVLDSAFPFQVNEVISTEFPNRVIRSATVDEDGERSAWRTFLQEDHIDLPQDRGRVINMAPTGSNILIHTTEALFQTRADQRIKTTGDSAFVGSGDLFRPTPREVINLDEGYGGLLDHRAAQVYERGYIFVDKEAGKVIQFTDQPQEISNQGMRKFFRDNLTPSSEPRVGYDPHTGKIFVSDKSQGWTYSFHPQLKAWISRHSTQSEYYFTTRDHLYQVIGDRIYRVGTGEPGEYAGDTYPFEIEYIQSSPRPESEIVVSLIIDSRAIENGSVISKEAFDKFRIQNSYQDTELTEIRTKTSENGKINSNANARLTDQAWKINEIRDAVTDSPIDKSWKKKRRLADNFHRVKLVYDTDGRVMEVFSSALVTRTSRR